MIWVTPALILFLVFYVLPVIQGFFYSFTNWDGFKVQWIGITNYMNLLSVPRLSMAFKNTFIFTVVASFGKVILGLTLAIFVNRELVTKNYLRVVFFSPVLISNVAVAVIFTSILHPTQGILNIALRSIGLDFLALNWLTDVKLVIYSICMIEIWKWTGFTMIIVLAGLQGISNDIYESAYIDGVNTMQKHIHITIPLIMPTLNNAIIINIIGGLRVFDIIVASTGGGPGYASSVINTIVYTSFGSGKYGEAAAAEVLLAIIVVSVVYVSRWVLSKYEQEV